MRLCLQPALRRGEECTAEARCVARQGTYAPPTDDASDEEFSETEAAEYESASAAVRARASARYHDGFFLRLGIGLGSMSATRSYDTASVSLEQSMTGIGSVYEISIGGSVTPGVALGGGVYGTEVYSTTNSLSVRSGFPVLDGDYESEKNIGASTLALLCPFVNVYFNPRSGFNGEAGPCLALADFNGSGLHQGLGLNLGLGVDWFVSDAWSVGFQARVQYASVSYEDDEPLSVWIPGALFTATYN